jgi:hypothetical protein
MFKNAWKPKEWVLACLRALGKVTKITPRSSRISHFLHFSKAYSVYYEQASPTDYSILQHLSQCFGLFSSPGHNPRGLHNGLLRYLQSLINLFHL